MRKLKRQKEKIQAKEAEKRNKKVADLFQVLIKQYQETHDKNKIAEISQEILELKPEQRYFVENTASVNVDNHITSVADQFVTYLEENFPPYCYGVFLRSRVYDLQHNYGGAIEAAERALTLEPVDMLYRMMIHNILGHLYRYVGDADKSLEHYEISAKMSFDGMPAGPALTQCEKIRRDDYSNFLFSLHNVNVSRERIMQEIVDFNKFYEGHESFTHSPETHPRHEKIRIGYVSPDIRRHVVAFFSYALFKCYDKSKFEVYIYAKNEEDHVTAEFKKCVDKFEMIVFDTPKVAAQKIKDDEIDILVDLAGHTANNCLDILSYKPAPIIVSGIGWFNTTGFKTVDYFMVDKYTDPVGLNEQFFSEKLLRLQHSHFCYMWHDAPSPVTAAPCTKNGYITFVSFNAFTKMTDEMLRLWARILNAVPNSKLFLKGKNFRDEYGKNYTLGRFAAVGISEERLICEQDETAYLHKYNETDIALDTFPYPGGGTTCDALYMGIPVITLVGERHNSRFGYSLLHNMGLDELCAFSEEEYVQKAVELANDWDRIRDYHLTLRRRMITSTLMNDVIYMAEVEEAYEKIFHAWQEGKELPDFPQDAPEITPELAEEFYNRALHYIELENHENNIVNIKRALYFFEQAVQADKEHLAEIYLFMAACRQELSIYADAYDAICKCGEIIAQSENPEQDFSKTFLAQYHERRGSLALLNGKSFESAEHYEQAANLSEGDMQLNYVSRALSSLHFLDISSEDMATTHFQYQNLVKNIQPFTTYHEKNPRVKVGYVSQNFTKQAMFSVVLGILSTHDRNKFEVTCYSLSEEEDAYTNIYKDRVEHFENVSNLSCEELAEKIHADNIDILVDLSGHSAGNALPTFAYRPAPVQVSGIAYMTTTGMKAMDYFITDPVIDPIGRHEKYFSEKLLHLPSLFCYAYNSDATTPEGAPCKKNNFVTFGTICHYSKISDGMLHIWKDIFDRLPDAKLIMRAEEFSSISTMNRLYSRMKEIGFNMDQINFQPAAVNYLDVIKDLDIILDVYPYSGAITTLDALYMGVPVLTLYGERRDTRFGLSILRNVGLGNWALNSVEDYINSAVAFAQNPDELDNLHKNLRTALQNSNNLSPGVYTKILEQAYLSILDDFEKNKN